MINVGIVDDHAIVRTGLRQFFSEQVDLRVVGEAAKRPRSHRSRAHDPRTGCARAGPLHAGAKRHRRTGHDPSQAPDVGILILSGYPEEHYAVNLIRQGADGYLNKECDRWKS